MIFVEGHRGQHDHDHGLGNITEIIAPAVCFLNISFLTNENKDV